MKTRLLILVAFVFLSGCSVIEFTLPEKPPSDAEILETYNRIQLTTSTATDVLATINIGKYELLSQSKSVIASAGQGKKGYRQWLKMVAFDEDQLTVMRKYLFIEDEKPRVMFVAPRAGSKFNCRMVLGSEILDKPYVSENTRRIAILGHIIEQIRRDIDQVGSDNKTIVVSGMMINQSLEAVLTKLNSSPAYAGELNKPSGLQFEHIGYDKAKIQMIIEGNIASIKLWTGSYVKLKLSRTRGKFESTGQQ